jgi:cob(I)alamin adenosyltransferase
MKIYTRKGDAGTTGLLFGGRIAKDAPEIAANGAVDEAQAALGVARALVARHSEIDALLVELERDLYVLMAELATAPANRHKLQPGSTLVTDDMVARLEQRIDSLTGRFPPLSDFVIPGHDPLSAALDVARTVVRRAERQAVGATPDGSLVLTYLNRLSDLVWTMARWQEHGESMLSRQVPGPGGEGSDPDRARAAKHRTAR